MTETLVAIFSILTMKLFAMVIGYKIVVLGYEALIRGTKGEFDFGGKIATKLELKLVSVSPGLFFVLFGSFIICWALFVSKPISSETTSAAGPISKIQPEDMTPKK